MTPNSTGTNESTANLDRRAAALTIEQAQREWEIAINAVQDLIFIHDADMSIIRANRAYAARTGKDIRDIIGQPYWKLFPKLDGPLPGCRRSLEERQSGEEELHLDSGEEYASRSYPICDAEGKYLYSLHVMQDVTAKRKAEAEQRTLSEALRQAAEAVLVLDADTRITYLNPAFYRLFGYAPDDIIGQPIAALSVPEREDNLQPSEVVRRLKENGTWRDEVWRRAKDGSAIPVRLSTAAIRDAKGGITGYVGTYLDLREAKQAEQALRIAAVAFETQEGILITDLDKRIIRVNRAFTRLTGYSAEEAIGRTPAMLQYERRDADFYRSTWETVARDKYWQGESWNRRKNGEFYPALLTISAVTDADGQATHYVTTFADITLQKKEEEAIQKLNEELAELAIRDGLTGLYNHRTFYKLLEDEFVRAQRFNHPVSLLLLDIDHFKHVNDTYGHLAGDAILKGLGELLGRQARAIDRVCRYGGEEITVILPETDLDAAANMAERMRAAVEAQSFDVEAGAPVKITVSIGVASWPAQADNMQTLVAAADAAMYAAKQSGRNRVVRYEPAPGQPS